jgi:hypothetical protein
MVGKVKETTSIDPVRFMGLALSRKRLFGFLAILILICVLILRLPYHIAYPEGSLTPEHQKNYDFLKEATRDRISELPGGTGELYVCYLPITGDSDFPQLTRKLRQLFESSRNQVIVLGGMDVHDIDRPILKAAKRLPEIEGLWTCLWIVSPSKISSATENTLREKNIEVEFLQETDRTRGSKSGGAKGVMP